MAIPVSTGNDLSTTVSDLFHLFDSMFLILGIMFLVIGIAKFYAFLQDPQSTPLSKPIVLFAIALCLIICPSLLKFIQTADTSAPTLTVSKQTPTVVVKAAPVALAAAAPSIVKPSIPVAKTNQVFASKPSELNNDSASNSNLIVMLEVLGGIGLITLGGWAMWFSRFKKFGVQRNNELALKLAYSKVLSDAKCKALPHQQ